MILENSFEKGNMVLSQADAKSLIGGLSYAVEEAADHGMSHPAVTFVGNSEKERLAIWVSPK